MTDYSGLLPPMLFGEKLKETLAVLPAYDASARDMDAGSRLLRLSDIYQIFVPTSMTVEIYHKLYMMTAASMSKKGTADAARQLNANYQGNAGVITGMTSSTVIAPSGMGKSSSIHKAVSLFGDLIEVDSPYQKICPVVCVTTPFDANYKGLLIQIAKELDRHLDSDFYVKSQKSTMNAQQLLAMICQVCTLHVGLLIVDEIQFLAEHKYAGPQILRMLLQLVNSSCINMLMVGTNECIPFFQKVPQIARRTAGLQYSAMEYGSDFTELCRVLFSYQYVKEYTELSDVILQWVFEHSAGIPASLAALLHDAQEIAIMENIEALDLKTLDMAYNRRMQMLHPHILPSITKVSRNRHKKEKELQIDETENVKTDDWVSIAGIIQDSKKYGNDIVTEIMKHLPVVEVVEN